VETKNPTTLRAKAEAYLHKLCVDIPTRQVGSRGNRAATDFFAATAAAFGFDVSCPAFDCIDWASAGASLTAGGQPFAVRAAPYSTGCRAAAPIASASTVEQLQALRCSGEILLLHGDLTREQLMPKHFPFYNPEHHQQIVQLLEEKAPAAIVAATGRNPEMAGGLYPFPLIEDGDFDIPSAYMTELEGERLLPLAGQVAGLEINAERIPARGCNVIAHRGGAVGSTLCQDMERPDSGGEKRLVVCAHIDAKMGTPGALDNATGVVVLLLLAELLAGYTGEMRIEIVAFNGEDYYSAPGQVLYLKENADRLSDILLGINLDGAGYHKGNSAYSLYDCPPQMSKAIHGAFVSQPDTIEGQPWYQSDHSIFIQNGIPALAITSDHFSELWTQVAHTENDTPKIVDCTRLVATAQSLRSLVLALDQMERAIQ
jgi:aminopeptidase YwaD